MTTKLPPSAPEARPSPLGKYQLLKRIATGGMAEIWVAGVAGISGVQQICVVKRILPEFASSPEFVRMFLDEARIVAALNHPNLIQTHDVGEVSGNPFIAMEYLHGEDLRAIKKALKSRRKIMPIEHAVNIVINAAAGLHYAHEKVGFDGQPMNIVHRDITPHNLFITADGGVKILDFGIAKARNRHNETRNGALKGKFPYMSPEQCMGKPLDRRSDLYSLGVILYEITTGRRLYKPNSSEFEVMRSIVDDAITPPSQLVSSYPVGLERIVLKCLAKDRDQRYASARELQAELSSFAQEERLAVSTIALSSFMSAVFGERVEAWREALASGGDLLAHIEERPPESVAFTADDEDKPTPADALIESQPVPPADMIAARRSAGAVLEVRPRGAAGGAEALSGILSTSKLLGVASQSSVDVKASAASASAGASLKVTRRSQGELLILGLSGKMTEGFEGKALAQGLSGRVLFDLGGVQRITSFGVREWLEMLNAISKRVSGYYLCRCPEAVVNQMSMIRRFSGDGQIVSFYGPYRCEACGQGFQRLFDSERDAAAIQAGCAPAASCPRCGTAAVFDDDAKSYVAFARESAGVPVPADVRAALEEIARAEAASAGGSIEKTIEDHETKIRVRAKLDAAVRWPRVLDGIEGKLVFDLEEIAGVTHEGTASLELALRALGDEVTLIEIEAAPRLLVEHLAAARPLSRVHLRSAVIDARCPSCDAVRPSVVSARECELSIKGDRDPYVPCKRCNTPLSFATDRELVRLVAGERPAAETIPAPPMARGAAAASALAPPPAPVPAPVPVPVFASASAPPPPRASPPPRAPSPVAAPAPLAAAPAPPTSPLVFLAIAIVTAIIVVSLARAFFR